MKAMLNTLLITIFVTFSSGCTTMGLSIRESGCDSYNSVISGLYQINKNSALSQPFKLPCSLAVAQIGETAPPSSVIKALRKEKSLFKRVTSVPLVTPQNWGHYRYSSNQKPLNDSVANMIRMGQDMGVDYIYLVGGNIDTVNVKSVFSLLDLAVLPGFIVPSTRVKLEGKVSGALIDVKTGKVKEFTTADKKSSFLSPTFRTDESTKPEIISLRDQLLTDSVTSLTESLHERL